MSRQHRTIRLGGGYTDYSDYFPKKTKRPHFTMKQLRTLANRRKKEQAGTFSKIQDFIRDLTAQKTATPRTTARTEQKKGFFTRMKEKFFSRRKV